MFDRQPAFSDNRIERLAAKIQTLPPGVRWLHAQQTVIQALACGRPPPVGPRTAIIDAIVRIAGSVGLARSIAALVTLSLTFWLYVAQGFTPLAVRPRGPLFVGIGAMREAALIKYWEAIQGAPALVVNETDKRTLFRYRKIGLRSLIAEWIVLWRELWNDLGAGADREGLDATFRISLLMRRGHGYVYARAWFRRHVKDDAADVAFTAASYVASAAIAGGASAVYLVHGFQRHSLVLPDFSGVHCFNQPEAAHFRSRLPGARVTTVVAPWEYGKTERVAAVTSVYAQDSKMALCESFVAWARRRSLPVVIREHPQDRSNYWRRWRDTDGISFADRGEDFPVFLDRCRPRLLVSWSSTTLCDAIAKGVVPVLLTANDPDLEDFIFPLRQIALAWPEDSGRLEAMVDDAERCAEFAAAKYAQAIAPRA